MIALLLSLWTQQCKHGIIIGKTDMRERTKGVTIQKDGMLVRTLFSEKKIPGHEIHSIEYDDKCVLTVTLNSGKVIKFSTNFMRGVFESKQRGN